MKLRQLLLLIALAPTWTPALAELVLREDTASQTVVIGPFVDSTDGNTAETGLTIDAADVRLSKNGANIVGKNSGGCTHDELGYYACTFDATDSDTVGRLQVMVHESGALPVYHEFQVAEEAVYDACCASGAAPLTAAAIAALDVSDNDDAADSWGERISRIPNAAPGGNGGLPTVNASNFVAGALAVTTLNGLANNVITANSINADAFTAAKFAADVTTEFQSGLMTAAAGAVIDAIVDQLLVGVNVEQMNGEDICGTGDSGTPWTGCP